MFDQNRLIETLRKKLNIDNDANLAKALSVSPLLISNMRKCKIPIWGSMLLHMSDVSKIDVANLRRLMGDRRQRIRLSCIEKKFRNQRR